MSDTETLVKALRILARDIESGDGVANPAIAEAAGQLEEQQERIRLLISERDSARQQADQNWKLRKEFEELLGTADVQEAVRRVNGLQARIRRLEQAGDSMAAYIASGIDVDEWRKAKEAKP